MKPLYVHPLKPRSLNVLAKRAPSQASGMIFPLGVAFQLFRVEINFAQVARPVSLHLIFEVPRRRMSAFAAGSHGSGMHSSPNSTTATKLLPLVPYHFLCPGRQYRAGRKRRQRTPGGIREPHGVLGCESLNGCTISPCQALKTVDVSPGRLPRAEIRGQFFGGRSQAFKPHLPVVPVRIYSSCRGGGLLPCESAIDVLAPEHSDRRCHRIHAPPVSPTLQRTRSGPQAPT